ncbi:Amidinotransferase [Chitinophaga sp. 180180018-2]|nr:Amidinotransferase [Chitinophaga sp. 212800010-3]
MTILMIQPARFEFNNQTDFNSDFQRFVQQRNVHMSALKEFERFTDNLTRHGIQLLIVPDSIEPHTPDSIFPNNWISTHEGGRVVLYPMYAPNIREVRKPAVIDLIGSHFQIEEIVDYTFFEESGLYLEGNGSMVLDRINKIAYACLSPRTNSGIFQLFCKQLGYEGIIFEAFDQRNYPIYHTNIMMCLADRFVLINMDSVAQNYHRRLYESFEKTHKSVIPITFAQMNNFAGNILQVPGYRNINHLVMSSSAFASLTQIQLKILSSYNPIVHSSLVTIERHGRCSAGSMMAEIVLRCK